ncbi:MAG TPA: hypothetical protein VHT31_00380 [Candidatus Acidoferrum sp.]|jgi:hypothetical protein|nr:hypothetical protein [Candidatus Acidoferrum sp.]
MKRTKFLGSFAMAVTFGGLAVCGANAQQNSKPANNVVALTGLTGVKDNQKGRLTVENGKLLFQYGKKTSDISAPAIEDVVTGEDTQAAIGKTASTLSMAAPYGSGRFLALFRTKFDTLTLRYRDENGALHGAIFALHTSDAEPIKKDLLAQGAHTTAGEARAATAVAPTSSTSKEQKQ